MELLLLKLIPDWAPNIHPMVVHFPIAILGIAIFFDFISFFMSREKKWWTEEATAFLYGIGALAAIIVYYTGTLAADSVAASAAAESVMSNHADWAWWTIWFYGIYAVARIAATWWSSEKHRLKFHLGFFLLSFGGLFLLFQTGDHGARMVFEYGVGVQAVEVENPVEHDEEGETESHTEGGSSSEATSFSIEDNGNWTWEIEDNAVPVLSENFNWLSGSAEAVNAEAVETENGHALSFSGDNLNGFFAGTATYEKEQINYNVDMSSFDGTVLFVNHVQDKNNYDFVSIASDGTVKQGRRYDGETTIFKEGSTDVSQPLFVRVVGNGEHYKGYINKELVVHGHGDAQQPGTIGLKLDGSGTLLLQKLSLTQL
jgi:uncharacterized membrane protein